jgi:hypothetical protein
VAEDVDQHDDADGCPDLDDDHDGVPDATDACLDQQETINGRDDTDGCPDAGRGAWTGNGAGSTGFALTGALHFAADGSLPASDAGALDQLAQWLRADGASDHQILVARADDARVAALRSALVARGITDDGEVVAEPGVHGTSVRVIRHSARTVSVAPSVLDRVIDRAVERGLSPDFHLLQHPPTLSP